MESYIRKYFFSALLIIAFALGIYILWPFIQLIVLAGGLAIVFYPICRWLTRVLRSRLVASILTVLLFLILLCGPLFIVGTVVFAQSQHLYAWIADHQTMNVLMAKASAWVSQFVPVNTASMQSGITGLASKFSVSIGAIFAATAHTLLSLLLVVMIMFYFLKDGLSWKKSLIALSPLSEKSNITIITRLTESVNGIIKGRLLVGVVQGVLMAIGLYIFGVPNAVLWGAFTVLASLIPPLGGGLIAIPAIIYLFVIGRDGAAIGLTLWGLLLVGTIDNILTPYLVSRAVAIHPLLVLLSLLGGITMLGPIGLLIGPLVISFIYALLSVYKSETA